MPRAHRILHKSIIYSTKTIPMRDIRINYFVRRLHYFTYKAKKTMMMIRDIYKVTLYKFIIIAYNIKYKTFTNNTQVTFTLLLLYTCIWNFPQRRKSMYNAGVVYIVSIIYVLWRGTPLPSSTTNLISYHICPAYIRLTR